MPVKMKRKIYVKVIKSSLRPNSWYAKYIGDVFEVKECVDKNFTVWQQKRAWDIVQWVNRDVWKQERKEIDPVEDMYLVKEDCVTVHPPSVKSKTMMQVRSVRCL